MFVDPATPPEFIVSLFCRVSAPAAENCAAVLDPIVVVPEEVANVVAPDDDSELKDALPPVVSVPEYVSVPLTVKF